MLKINVGMADRIIRVVAGLILLSLFFLFPDAWWRYWSLIGVVLVATGLMATCPLYTVLGLSTCPAKRV